MGDLRAWTTLSVLILTIGFGACRSRQNGASFVIEPAADTYPVETADLQVTLDEPDTLKVGRHEVTVLDPVYGETRRYEGVKLADLVERVAASKLQLKESAHVVLLANDGYRSIVSMQTLRAHDGVLAFRDIDAPTGQRWFPLPRTAQSNTPGPFYLVWPKTPNLPASVPWPYGLVKLEIWTKDPAGSARPNAMHPEAERGFRIFQNRCMSCHAVNGVGGSMGPELNVPANVTEYWDGEALRRFIRRPSSIRYASRMPTLTDITESELDFVLAYLRNMKQRKVRMP